MARISFPVIMVAVVLANIPGGLAGAGCTNRDFLSAEDCITQCTSRFGWLGHIMGSDPWGMVIRPAGAGEDPQSAVEIACKAKFADKSVSSTSNAAATPTQVVNAQSAPPASITPASSAAPTAINLSASGFQTFTRASSSAAVSSSAAPSSTSVSVSRGIVTVSSLFHQTATANTAIVSQSDDDEDSSTAAPPPPKTTSSAEPTSQAPPPPKTTSQPPPPPQSTTSQAPPPPKTTSKAAPPPQTTSDGNGNGDNGSGNNGNGNGGSSGGGNNGGGSSGGGTVSAADQQAYLTAHNTVRAKHGASPLSWADDLEAAAQKWANNCVFKHSGGTLGPFGENLAAGTGSSYTIATAVNSWAVEVSQYDPSNPQASHFTQMVWKASTQVGCAFTSCSGIFSADFGKAAFHVCEYRLQGNVIGEFDQNVQV